VRFIHITVLCPVILAAAVRAQAQSPVVNVSSVEQLYRAVATPANAGATVVLAPGPYVLTVLDPVGAATLGRLELQPNMSLSGVPGHPEDVIIDSSGLEMSSFAVPGGNTGTIRIGRGQQSVEWLTVIGGAASAAGVETDLTGPGDPPPVLRIAHVIARDGIRGIDVRNLGPAEAGRVLTVVLADNELTNNVVMNGQGIRFVNTNANGAAIVASLHGNWSHANNAGFLASNQASIGASVTIDSYADRFEDNDVGGVVYGGLTTAGPPGPVSNDNSTTVNIHAGSIANNTGVFPPNGFTGGLTVVGGVAGQAGATSGNNVQVSIWGTTFAGNVTTDVKAWGAFTLATSPAGTDNAVAIDLHGVSAHAETDAQASSANEPHSTNSATIVK
jgi:hypothetical protein